MTSNYIYDRLTNLVTEQWVELGISLPIYDERELELFAIVFWDKANFLFGPIVTVEEIVRWLKSHNSDIDCTCGNEYGYCWYRLSHYEACEHMADNLVYNLSRLND
jgi:hypothetical protein